MSQPQPNPYQGLPSVDIAFFIALLAKNPKIQTVHNKGASVTYVMKGSKPLLSRMIVIRNIGGVVDFDFATATCAKLKCMDELLEWFKENRSWKDGAYFVK